MHMCCLNASTFPPSPQGIKPVWNPEDDRLIAILLLYLPQSPLWARALHSIGWPPACHCWVEASLHCIMVVRAGAGTEPQAEVRKRREGCKASVVSCCNYASYVASTPCSWEWCVWSYALPFLRLTVSSSRTALHLVQFLALKWQLKHGDSEDSLQLFHTYSKWRSMGLSPSTVPTNNCDSVGNCDLVENHEGEQTVESPVAEVPQGVASQRCCTTSSPVPEVDVQREGQQVNQEVATSEGSGNNLGQAGDLQCKSNTDGALCSCVATKILSPEIDSKSPQTQTVATSKHPSKCDYGQEKFSEPLYSEENASDSGSQFGITSRRLLFNSKCTLREIHYKVHSSPNSLSVQHSCMTLTYREICLFRP